MAIFDNIENRYGVFSEFAAHNDRRAVSQFDEDLYKKYFSNFAQKYYLANVEWRGRHYLASKKIAMSALFYTQAEALIDKKMKNLSFYACYYALFNGLSSNLLLHPHIELKKARSISHSALGSNIENFFVRQFVFSNDTMELLGDLRFARELYSYHLPLSGNSSNAADQLDTDSLFSKVTNTLPLILQTSDLLSHLIYDACKKKVGHPVDEYSKYQRKVDDFFHSIVGHDDSTGKRAHYDDGDYSQLGYYLTKIGQPMPISWLIADKVLDELESSWVDNDDESSGYDINSVSSYLARIMDF
jgi:hypothetical protein